MKSRSSEESSGSTELIGGHVGNLRQYNQWVHLLVGTDWVIH